MKLEPNMYVRTKDNGIGKIAEYINDPTHYFFKCCKLYRKHINYEEYITKSDVIGEPSYDIMDLIKVGDYVNGYKVTGIGGTYHGRKDRAIYCDYQENEKTGKWIMIYDDEIKSIVTKEQFESINYKVGDNNE